MLSAVVLLLLATSCATNKTTYFENLDVDQLSGKLDVGDYELQIAPDDMLSITVSSVVPDAAAPYNLPAVSYSEPGKKELTTVPNLQVYTVSKDGYIYFPSVGRIHAAGLTRTELAEYIEDKIRPELKDPFVLVQFMNFKVVVLGEVKSPGQIPVQTERISILDAIGAAGDLTIYGDGSQTRSFCYVDDLIEVIVRMMASEDGFLGPVNTGNPGEFTIKELAELVREKVNKNLKIVYKPLPSDDPTQRRPDITLAKTKLGWEPKIKLAEGLDKTIEYFDKKLKGGI